MTGVQTCVFRSTEASLEFPAEVGSVPKPPRLKADGTPWKPRGSAKAKKEAAAEEERYVFGVPFATGQPLYPTILSGGTYLGAAEEPSAVSFIGSIAPAEQRSELERQRKEPFSGSSGMGSGLSGTDVSFFA